jgi:osmotically-inducible protein OsmY
MKFRGALPLSHHRRSIASGALPTLLALIAAYGAAACSTLPTRTPAERTADAAMAAEVESVLRADPNIYARHIDVSVDRGVVELGGFVWTNQEYLLARNDAASVPGVRAVNTQMDLLRGGLSGTGK